MPARANIPPSAAKSFCMSTTTTAVREGSTASGLGRASISIAQTLTRAPPPAKRLPRAGFDAARLAERPRGGEEVVRRQRHQLLGRQVAELGAGHAREPERLRVERLLEDRPSEARVAEALGALGGVEDPAQRVLGAGELVLVLAREAAGDGEQLVGAVVREE